MLESRTRSKVAPCTRAKGLAIASNGLARQAEEPAPAGSADSCPPKTRILKRRKAAGLSGPPRASHHSANDCILACPTIDAGHTCDTAIRDSQSDDSAARMLDTLNLLQRRLPGEKTACLATRVPCQVQGTRASNRSAARQALRGRPRNQR